MFNLSEQNDQYTLSYSLEQGFWHIETLTEQLKRSREFFDAGVQDHYTILSIGERTEICELANSLHDKMRAKHKAFCLKHGLETT